MSIEAKYAKVRDRVFAAEDHMPEEDIMCYLICMMILAARHRLELSTFFA